nr:Gfo/Idh/MocA family oxidoreductase [Clostridia bacterium]
MFKIALIGCGYMAGDGHAPSAKLYAETHPDTELVSCCDIDISKSEAYCKRFGYKRAYSDYSEMIGVEKPDVVQCITPVKLTKKISIDVINTGTNIILEKPPGICSDDTKAIHEAAVRNKVHARVAFNRRHMPLVLELKQAIKECGQPISFVDCQFLRVGRTDDDFCTTAIHAIDSVKNIVGSDYRKVSFDYLDYEYKGDRRGTDYHIRAHFENGAYGNISFLPCSGCVVERIFVSCTDHAFFLELPVWGGLDMPGRLTCTTEGKVYKTVNGMHETIFESNGFYNENASFFDRIRRGQAPFSEVEGGIQSVEIADFMRRRESEYKKER